jgi:hypothetical protein
MSRDTRTGWVLEQMILPSLERGGYESKLRVKIGQRPGCGAHFVDVTPRNQTGSTSFLSNGNKFQELLNRRSL